MTNPKDAVQGERPYLPSRRSHVAEAAAGLAAGGGALPLRRSTKLAAETATPDSVNVTKPAYSGGADSTGANDSTAAIRAAINTATRGVYFLAGTYLVGNEPAQRRQRRQARRRCR